MITIEWYNLLAAIVLGRAVWELIKKAFREVKEARRGHDK